MYCPNCGEENVGDAKFCKGCGKLMDGTTTTAGKFEPESHGRSEPSGPFPEVPSHLVWAILVTIFCCLPFGIVSIVYAAQVNGMVAAGNIDGARQASQNAKIWAWVAFGVGIVLGLPAWIGGYAILGPIGLIMIGLPGLLVGLVALAIVLYVSNPAKRN